MLPPPTLSPACFLSSAGQARPAAPDLRLRRALPAPALPPACLPPPLHLSLGWGEGQESRPSLPGWGGLWGHTKGVSGPEKEAPGSACHRGHPRPSESEASGGRWALPWAEGEHQCGPAGFPTGCIPKPGAWGQGSFSHRLHYRGCARPHSGGHCTSPPLPVSSAHHTSHAPGTAGTDRRDRASPRDPWMSRGDGAPARVPHVSGRPRRPRDGAPGDRAKTRGRAWLWAPGGPWHAIALSCLSLPSGAEVTTP